MLGWICKALLLASQTCGRLMLPRGMGASCLKTLLPELLVCFILALPPVYRAGDTLG